MHHSTDTLIKPARFELLSSSALVSTSTAMTHRLLLHSSDRSAVYFFWITRKKHKRVYGGIGTIEATCAMRANASVLNYLVSIYFWKLLAKSIRYLFQTRFLDLLKTYRGISAIQRSARAKNQKILNQHAPDCALLDFLLPQRLITTLQTVRLSGPYIGQ